MVKIPNWSFVGENLSRMFLSTETHLVSFEVCWIFQDHLKQSQTVVITLNISDDSGPHAAGLPDSRA